MAKADFCMLVRVNYDKGARGRVIGDVHTVHAREQFFSSVRAARAYVRGLAKHEKVKRLTALSFRCDSEYDVSFLHLVPKVSVDLHRKRAKRRFALVPRGRGVSRKLARVAHLSRRKKTAKKR